MDTVSCLENVIGISKNPCVCYDVGREDEFGESLSGYYMDNHDYGLPLSYPLAVHDCDHNDLWDLCVEARRQGANHLVTELGASMVTSKWISAIPPYNGNVGDVMANSNSIATQDTHGLCIDPIKYKGVSLQLNEVRVRGEGADGTAVTVDVYLERDLIAGTVTPAYTMGGVLNSNQVILRPASTIRIDLIDSTGNSTKVYIVSTLGGFIPFDSPLAKSTGCGSCGGRPRTAPTTWKTWITAGGIQAGADPLELLTAPVVANKSYGLQASITMSCGSNWLCQPLDWINDEWARVVAELLLLYSNRTLISYILRSDKANVYTAVRSGELHEKQAYIDAETEKRLSWAVNNLPHDLTDCYSCRVSTRKRTILI